MARKPKPLAQGGGVMPRNNKPPARGAYPAAGGVAMSGATAWATGSAPTAGATPSQTAGSPQGGANPGPSEWERYQAQIAEQQAAQLKLAQDNAIAAIRGTFSNYGLGSLGSKIEEYVRKGYSGDTVALLLRKTPEYKARFPAMEALAQQGRAISEGEYIQYERSTAQIERMYGLPSGMLSGNVTKMLTMNLSVQEIGERAGLAAANALTAPDVVKQQMQDYYGLGPGALTAYYLDPDVALPILQKQAAAARVGAAATRQGLNVGRGIAEDLVGQGVSEDEAQKGFAGVKATEQFGYGRGETISQDERTAGVFGDADATRKMQRVAESRTGRFQAGGAFATDRSGYSGLGGAAR